MTTSKPVIALGIHDGHDAGACILKDGRIIAAVNEERLVREKLYTGIPFKSIVEVMRLAGVKPHDIDHVAIAGQLGLMANLGWAEVDKTKRLYQFICRIMPWFAGSMAFVKLQRFLFAGRRHKGAEKYARSLGITAPVSYEEHHYGHAASAYYTSGKDPCLVVSADGSGDGLSGGVYLGKNGLLYPLSEVPTFHSIGYFYGYVTVLAGFKMFRHEGKITGLAAHGDPKKTYGLFSKWFGYRNGKPTNFLKLMGQDAMHHMKNALAFCTREHWAAGVQRRLEDVMAVYVADWVHRTGIRDIALAGGVMANVRSNQAIAELPCVDSCFIHPHMGDGGLAVGAALWWTAKHFAKNNKRLAPYRLHDVYFGPSWTNAEIEQSVKKYGLKAKYVKNVEDAIGKMVAAGRVVGNFDGRMEYGPRALGNRSILALPTDKSVNDWLNKRCRRTEFMPFAPSLAKENAAELFHGFNKGVFPAEFMTITFQCTEPCQVAEAIVHIDNTARPQVVTKEVNPRYYKILQAYKKASGLPIFINTSFNIHEEPIVCSPDDAIRSFLQDTVDVLVMGNWVLDREDNKAKFTRIYVKGK
ncbi:hypothetical protein HY642_01605 [Candidatus Woesearchaeota archaeon]|nr:hypothetical protein [Candidatus Woesearchaeota archaeon]